MHSVDASPSARSAHTNLSPAPQARRRKLAAGALGALAAWALVACGGAGTSTTTDQAEPDSAVQLSLTETKLSVSAAGPAGAASQAGGARWAAMQFVFAAKPTAGADPGLGGTLLLRSEAEDGATELEGRLIAAVVPAASAPASAPAGNSAALKALVAEIKAAIEPLRTAFAAQVDSLKQKLKADLAAATTDAARQAAKQAFATAFKAAHDKYQQGVAAVLAQFRDKLAALGVTDPASVWRRDGGGHGGDDGRQSRNGYEVEGTQSADGAVALQIKVAKGATVKATGKAAADGSMSGTYTGPGAADAGSWTAKPSATPAP